MQEGIEAVAEAPELVGVAADDDEAAGRRGVPGPEDLQLGASEAVEVEDCPAPAPLGQPDHPLGPEDPCMEDTEVRGGSRGDRVAGRRSGFPRVHGAPRLLAGADSQSQINFHGHHLLLIATIVLMTNYGHPHGYHPY